MSLQNFYDFAVETAWQAGRLTLGYYQTGLRPDFKADDSPVTLADKEAEQFIRSRIESRFPDHAIVGEEYGAAETEGATHRWFVDPIDGTRDFIRGRPGWCVSVALVSERRPLIGMLAAPAPIRPPPVPTSWLSWWMTWDSRTSGATAGKSPARISMPWPGRACGSRMRMPQHRYARRRGRRS